MNHSFIPAFTDVDHNNILVSVYGISNTCAYFDWAPSVYVLPVLWCFDLVIGIVYAGRRKKIP